MNFALWKNLDRKQEIPFELFKKAIDELDYLKFEGLIGFSGFCEPTLHTKIKELIHYTKHVLPKVTLVLNTNSDTIYEYTITKFEQAGLDYLIVSVYDEATYHRVNSYSSDITLMST